MVEAVAPLRKGDALRMDFGPGKLDSAVLLDYGALDGGRPQVRAHACTRLSRMRRAWG